MQSNLMQGFATLPGILSLSEIRSVAERLGGLDSAGSRRLLQEDWCRELAKVVRKRVAATWPECERMKVVQATYFNKTSTSNWFVAYHQDRSIPVSDRTSDDYRGWSRKEGMTFVQPPAKLLSEMFALRLHIDDCQSDNGPLQVLPGTHRSGMLPQGEIDHYRARYAAVELTAERGSVVALRPLLLHASCKSRSARPRRVLHFLCGPERLPGGLEWGETV